MFTYSIASYFMLSIKSPVKDLGVLRSKAPLELKILN